MAHFRMPPGGDPDTIAWLSLPRAARREAMHGTREAMKSARFIKEHGKLTKAQRRQATPWQPIVVPPGDAHFLAGRPTTESARLIVLGLNRRERRALRSKRGPRENVVGEASFGGHVSRSDRRLTPLLSRAHLYHRAESKRQRIAAAQTFQGSLLGKLARGAAVAAAVPVVAAKRVAGAIKGLFRRFTG